jgi:uncharacterized protein DUF4124
MKRALVILLGSLAVTSAFATTYVRVEADGTKTYSDRPIPGGQPIEIQAAQTYSAAPNSAQPDSNLPLEQRLLTQMDSFKYDSCTVQPKRDETFMNPESVAIGVQLKPLLRPGDVVDMRIDGTTVGDAATTSFTMRPVFRGTHTVSVVVKDRFGRELCNANSSFHVHQPSLNSPTRQAPPKPPPKPTPKPKG